MFIYIYIYIYIFVYIYVYIIRFDMPFFFENVKIIKSTTRYLKYSYISIFTNLLCTEDL